MNTFPIPAPAYSASVPAVLLRGPLVETAPVLPLPDTTYPGKPLSLNEILGYVPGSPAPVEPEIPPTEVSNPALSVEEIRSLVEQFEPSEIERKDLKGVYEIIAGSVLSLLPALAETLVAFDPTKLNGAQLKSQYPPLKEKILSALDSYVPPAPVNTGSTKGVKKPKNGKKKEGLQTAQERVLRVLATLKEGQSLTRSEIAQPAWEDLSGGPIDQAWLTENIGSENDEKRAKNDEKHYPSLITLGLVGRSGRSHYLTAKGWEVASQLPPA
jgi:hypothetical protein